MCARDHVGYPARNCSSPVAALDPGLPILLAGRSELHEVHESHVCLEASRGRWLGGNPHRLAHVGLSAVCLCRATLCRGINGWGGPAVQVGKGGYGRLTQPADRYPVAWDARVRGFRELSSPSSLEALGAPGASGFHVGLFCPETAQRWGGRESGRKAIEMLFWRLLDQKERRVERTCRPRESRHCCCA